MAEEKASQENETEGKEIDLFWDEEQEMWLTYFKELKFYVAGVIDTGARCQDFGNHHEPILNAGHVWALDEHIKVLENYKAKVEEHWASQDFVADEDPEPDEELIELTQEVEINDDRSDKSGDTAGA